jgi:hypothetical protein
MRHADELRNLSIGEAKVVMSNRGESRSFVSIGWRAAAEWFKGRLRKCLRDWRGAQQSSPRDTLDQSLEIRACHTFEGEGASGNKRGIWFLIKSLKSAG